MMDEAKLDKLAADVAYLVERQQRMEEFVTEMQPIARLAMGVATDRLQEMEEKGYFRFARTLVNISDRVVSHYGEEDLAEMVASAVRVLDTLRALAQPEVLTMVAQAGQSVQHRDQYEPLGLTGLVQAGGDQEVQRGMAVLMDLLRQLGRAADAMQKSPKRSVPASAPVARPMAAPVAQPVPPPPATRGPSGLASSGRYAKAPACKPVAPGPAAATVDGIAYMADGFLADPSQWTRELALTIAVTMGLELGEAHWKLIDFARSEWQQTGVSPNIRRLSTGSGMSTREIYQLFPKAPGKSLARFAGVPKPTGCI